MGAHPKRKALSGNTEPAVTERKGARHPKAAVPTTSMVMSPSQRQMSMVCPPSAALPRRWASTEALWFISPAKASRLPGTAHPVQGESGRGEGRIWDERKHGSNCQDCAVRHGERGGLSQLITVKMEVGEQGFPNIW